MRWRDGARFMSLDSYSGNASDPISLHKYLYAHANPVMGVDPSGMMNLAELNVTSALQNMMLTISKVNRAYQTVNKVLNAADTISTILAISQMNFTGFISDIRQKISKKTFGKYASRFTKNGIQDGIDALLVNVPLIAVELLKNPVKMADLASAMKGSNPAFVILLPTPPIKNVFSSIPPIKIGKKLGRLRIPVYLAFGPENHSGRFVGLAISPDYSTNHFDWRAEEVFHMDYIVHAAKLPVAMQKEGNWAVWLSQDKDFEFQIPK